MITMGKKGLREVAVQSTNHYALEQLTKTGKFKPLFNKPFSKNLQLQALLKVKS